MKSIKIANIGKSTKHTHTITQTPESITGDVAFDLGALLLVTGIDTWAAVGLTSAQAKAGGAKVPTNFPMYIRLAPESRVIYIDAITGGEVSIVQVD